MNLTVLWDDTVECVRWSTVFWSDLHGRIISTVSWLSRFEVFRICVIILPTEGYQAEVLMAATMKISVLWVVVPFLVDRYHQPYILKTEVHLKHL
jgi:hypothetical protein